MNGDGIRTRIFGSRLGDALGLPVTFMQGDAFYADRGLPAKKYPAW